MVEERRGRVDVWKRHRTSQGMAKRHDAVLTCNEDLFSVSHSCLAASVPLGVPAVLLAAALFYNDVCTAPTCSCVVLLTFEPPDLDLVLDLIVM